jgi:putative membrane protein insertion efficiency factor
MGHRHTSKEQRGKSAVCGVDGGFAAAAQERMKTPGVRAALFAIRLYRANLSAWFGGSCVFEPTCSQYTYEAIERFGVVRGTWLGLKRLLRCHPFSGKFGLDAVPESWEEMNTSPEETHRHGEVHS